MCIVPKETDMSAANNLLELERWERDYLLAFTHFLTDFEPSDDKLFTAIVRIANDRCGVSVGEIAKQLEIDTSTVGRWATGKNRPHPAIRRLVTETIKRAIERHAEALDPARIPAEPDTAAPPREAFASPNAA
jgi:DNA-binding transcriptional regulator YiaG